MLALFHRITESVDAFWERMLTREWFAPEGPKRDRCPKCGGTDYFNGYGTCQECDDL